MKWHIPIPYSPVLNSFYSNQREEGAWALVPLILLLGQWQWCSQDLSTGAKARRQTWYHLVENYISFKMTPNIMLFESLCERYPRKTGFSQNGGHFGRHLGFWEMYNYRFKLVTQTFLKRLDTYSNKSWVTQYTRTQPPPPPPSAWTSREIFENSCVTGADAEFLNRWGAKDYGAQQDHETQSPLQLGFKGPGNSIGF